MNVATQTGYGPQVGVTPEGHPIYLYTDPNSKLSSYVVVLPNGKAFYADSTGKISARPVDANKQIGLALIGGLIGFALGGPGGAIAGAAVGTVLASLPPKKAG